MSLKTLFRYRNLHQSATFKNGIFLDDRKIGERKVINSGWVPKNGKASLRIERIDEKDFELVRKFYNYQFVKNGNVWRTIGAKYEDTEKLISEATSLSLKFPFSYAAFNENELVGIHLNRLHTRQEFPQMFEGKLYDSSANLNIKEDYAEDIANGPYNLNGNRIYVMLNECLTQTGKFLPKDIKNLGYMKVTGIKAEYMGNGLFQYFFVDSLKTFKQQNCNYFIAFCLANASTKLCEKMGMWKAFCFPYSEYKENGNIVFQNPFDGAVGINLMMGKVDDAIAVSEKYI